MTEPGRARPWIIERRLGSAAELHADDLLSGNVRRRVVWMEADSPALVLGSSQERSVVDEAACAAHGVAVARRRSGGGAVLIEPDAVAWVDVVVPAGDPLADADVGRAMWWVGETWLDALASLGVVGAEVHRGPLVTTTWSRAVCFAGLGSGEVTLDGRKLVGVSQRRTRAGARFQSAVYRTWDPQRLVGLLAPPRPTTVELPPVATLSASVDAIRASFDAAVRAR